MNTPGVNHIMDLDTDDHLCGDRSGVHDQDADITCPDCKAHPWALLQAGRR